MSRSIEVVTNHIDDSPDFLLRPRNMRAYILDIWNRVII